MTRAPLPAADVSARSALRITTAARTSVDCAREWDVDDAVVAMDAALLACRGSADGAGPADGDDGRAGMPPSAPQTARSATPPRA